MTSSLVGSEMCIRDRRSSWSCRCQRRAGSGRACLCGSLGPCRRPWGPVSYTHLTLPTICSV
eukprot:10651722-Prorocentrum_lima.AAC.1